ncbi:MAG: hypothetical protein B7Y39_18895 [Bdellovibrio sp. 28-41-41]|nr:MAG: hypothetical protein B7Y39_18895 [Bdellovibrio sp. 28-41-41]
MVLNDGTVKLWGGGTTTAYDPAILTGVSGAADIAAAQYHTCIINTDKSLSCWGNNGYGELGLSDTTYRSTPTTVPGLANISSVIVAYNRTCALNASGIIYCWGENSNYIPGSYSYQLIDKVLSPELSLWMPQLETAPTGNLYKFCGLVKTSKELFCWNHNSSGFISTVNAPAPVYILNTEKSQKIVLSSSSKIINPGSCQRVDISLLRNSLAASMLYDLTVSLSDLAGLGNFYGDSNCSQTITQVTIPAGTSSNGFYYSGTHSDTTSQFAKIKANTNDIATGVDILNLEIIGLPYSLRPGGDFSGAYVGNCYSHIIYARDRRGNNTTATSSVPITLSSSNPTDVKIYSDSSCTQEITSTAIDVNASSKTIYSKLFVTCGYSYITITNTTLPAAPISTGFSIYQDCSCD